MQMQATKLTYRRGDTGQEVRRLQKKIGVAGDGVFGRKTQEAVKKYQGDNALAIDGIAGPKTLGSLGLDTFYGIDVSHWNGNVRWGSVDQVDCQFVWAKMSQGRDHYDKSREHNLDGCRSNGIPIGGYHFPSPHIGMSSNDPKLEVEQFLRALGPIQPGDMLPVLDLEAGVKGDPDHNRQWALEWLREFENETGQRCIIYTAKWYTYSYLKGDVGDLKNYPLWVANYTRGEDRNKLDRIEPKHLCGWDDWSAWQWTGSGHIEGLGETGIRKCDRNIIPGGCAAFNELVVK